MLHGVICNEFSKLFFFIHTCKSLHTIKNVEIKFAKGMHKIVWTCKNLSKLHFIEEGGGSGNGAATSHVYLSSNLLGMPYLQ